MRILVCAATSTEATACRRGITAALSQSHGSTTTFEVLHTGMGLENTRRALQQWVQQHGKPELVISTGFAGTIDLNIAVGSWIYATEVYGWQETRPTIPLLENEGILSRYSGVFANHDVHPVRMVSSPYLVDYKESTKVLQARFGSGFPVVVDMESAALAQVAQEQGISFLTLRMITDTIQQPLPRFLRGFVNASVSTNFIDKGRSLIKGVKGLLQEPKGILSLVKNGFIWQKKLEFGWRGFTLDILQITKIR